MKGVLKEISVQIFHAQLYKIFHALFDDLRSGINLRTLNITTVFFLQWTNNITYNAINYNIICI